MPQIVIDQERCNHCGACFALCNSGNVYAQKNDSVQVTNIENCWSCGHCVAVCPTDAIEHNQVECLGDSGLWLKACINGRQQDRVK